MAGLLALMAFVVLRHGGCRAVPSGPPPGAPPFASGSTGVMVTCGGGPELLWLAHTIVLVSAAVVWLLLALELVQTVAGRRFLPLPVRPPLRPRLFALGVAIAAAGVALVGLEALAPPMTAAGLLVLSNPLLVTGIVTMAYARGVVTGDGRRAGGLGA